jgi:hypothetical protein
MNAESVSRQLSGVRKNSAIAAGTLICSDDVQDDGLPAEIRYHLPPILTRA